MEIIKADIIPIALNIPNFLIGKTLEEYRTKKPIAVVTLVISVAKPSVIIVFFTAFFGFLFIALSS
jgi:hypothetical protein